MNILIIDDDKAVGILLAEHLKDQGHQTDYIDNGHEGLIAALEGKFDLLILDRRLPGNVDGLRLLKILRAEGIDTAVIILSGRSKVIDHIEGFRFGTDDYLAKPFSINELDNAVSSIVTMRSSKRSALQTQPHARTFHQVDVRGAGSPSLSAP